MRFVTATFTPSITPTQPTPTFTGTPTLIYSGPTATASNTPEPTITFRVQPTSDNSFQLTPQSSVFSSIQVSGGQIFWGICKPNSVTFKAKVVDATKSQLVTLWLRLQDKKDSSNSTDWGGGAIMDTDGKGTFIYNLSYKNISHYSEFKSAWVQYQLVASDRQLHHIGSTQVYLTSLSLAPCQ
jgi:hypothetical protein